MLGLSNKSRSLEFNSFIEWQGFGSMRGFIQNTITTKKVNFFVKLTKKNARFWEKLDLNFSIPNLNSIQMIRNYFGSIELNNVYIRSRNT